MSELGTYYKHGYNLALYRPIGEMQDFWEEYWQGDFTSLLQAARSGNLGEFEAPFTHYLPKDGPVLEAGCGRGRYVCALKARGYQVEGIDYAAQTVKKIREIAPDLSVREGDIYDIDVSDEYYAAYISIGVLEHNYGGPDAGLREAHRVLRPGGVALITVPYMNWARRRLWRSVPEVYAEELESGLRFYQDHVSVEVFSAHLEAAGFVLRTKIPYALYGGLSRDWRPGRWLAERNFFHWRIGKIIRQLCAHTPVHLREGLAHMMMFVCEKR